MRSPAASGIRGYAEDTFICAHAAACWCVCGGMQTGAAVSGFAPVEEQTKGQFSLSGLGGDADTGDDATRGLFPLPAHLQYNSLDP